MKRIATLAISAAMALALVACGGNASSTASVVESSVDKGPNASMANLMDFGWVAFEMPEGFDKYGEDSSEVEIRQEGSSDVIIKVSNDTTTFRPDAEAAADHRVEMAPDSYTRGEPFEEAGRTWYPVAFTFNDEPSVFLFADISGDYTVQITAYTLTEQDAAVKTIMDTIVFDEDFLG